MKHRALCIALPLVLASGIVLSAQDAGMVLRTSVTYNTQKATLPLTDDQRRRADELLREAQQSNGAGKYGDAMRSLYQGLAVMRNVPWTPAFEFATSLQVKLDHAIVEPGAQLGLRLTPLYTSTRDSAVKLSASLVLVPVKKEGLAEQPLGGPLTVTPAAALHYARCSTQSCSRRLHGRSPPGRRWRNSGAGGAPRVPEERSGPHRYTRRNRTAATYPPLERAA